VTPSPDEIARLESKLKPYLVDVAKGTWRAIGYLWWRVPSRAPSQAKEIVARLGRYKRSILASRWAAEKEYL
jgi:hypothetical protein